MNSVLQYSTAQSAHSTTSAKRSEVLRELTETKNQLVIAEAAVAIAQLAFVIILTRFPLNAPTLLTAGGVLAAAFGAAAYFRIKVNDAETKSTMATNAHDKTTLEHQTTSEKKREARSNLIEQK